MLVGKPVAASVLVGSADHRAASEQQAGPEQEIDRRAERARVHGFVAFDGWLTQASGFAVVECDGGQQQDIVADHVARRLTRRARRVLRTSSSAGGEAFRDVLARLGSSPLEMPRAVVVSAAAEYARICSARELAAKLDLAIASADPHDVGAVVVVDRRPSRYSQTVAAELEALLAQRADGDDATRAEPMVPVVWIVPAGERLLPPGEGFARLSEPIRFEIEAVFDAEAIATWWSAASAEPLAELVGSGPAGVEDLERWLRGARVRARAFGRDGAERGLTDRAFVDAARRLALASRPWPLSRLSALSVTHPHVEGLVDEGVADIRDEHVSLRGTFASNIAPALASVSPAEAATVADALTSVFPDDPWASIRASELLLSTGMVERGDALCIRALTSVLDAEARADFWARFVAVSPSPTPSAARLLPFINAALRSGDGEYALRLARDAVKVDPSDTRVVLAMGRALAASGDVTAATLTLARATQATGAAADVKGRAWVELAEVCYFASDVAGAREAATRAMEQVDGTTSPLDLGVHLDARNVAGKLLLAEGQFPAAERHFAEDACEASLAGQPVAELRATVNRAIALMSLGRRGDAQGMLETVLGEGEALGEQKAVDIALLNLAALAILDHRYGDALNLTERASLVLRKIGDKVSLARCVANLAQLRLRVGLLDEATQAVRFGGRIFRGGAPAEQAAQFSLVLARIALVRNDSATAHLQVVQALASLGMRLPTRTGETYAEHAGLSVGPVREHVSAALRLAARIAIDDGDTSRAQLLIQCAAAEGAPLRAQADLACLRAQLARSLGAQYEMLASEAVAAAREAGEDELLREAHCLLARAAVERGARDVARRHLDAAASVRDRVLDGLPTPLHAKFLARRDVRQIELEAATLVESRVDDGEHGSPSPPPSSAPPVSQTISVLRSECEQSRRIVGGDPSIRTLLHAIRRVGPSDATVLIHGESGTGKELVAEAVHEASGRRDGPLIKVNCAALVETLLLSELFGHEKGAFTGAVARRRGRFEAAEGGTLFLDEIGDISPRTQVALLRVLQERTFERVGGITAIKADVRVVCATHRDLGALVQQGAFREDLYYRLAGVVLEVPALRARLGDLGLIAAAVLRRIANERGGTVKRLSARALSALRSHPWPGNVRELENALRAASLFAESDVLEPEDFADNVQSLGHISETVESFATIPENVPTATPSDVAYAHVRSGVSLHDMKRRIERECIARALGDAGGNITRAATLLGMKRPRLSQLVKQYGLGASMDGADAYDDVSGADSSAAEEE
ncbi:MAG: sigma 54-interacting transcriptional regulator [Polyangiaceae bacterium]|nr:sigma 54-interacting transcriptional regulator [Polyangiaceae bacterium]